MLLKRPRAYLSTIPGTPLDLRRSQRTRLFRRKATRKLADDVAPNASAEVIVLSSSTANARAIPCGKGARRGEKERV